MSISSDASKRAERRPGGSSGFRAHEFRWDPFERVRIGWRSWSSRKTVLILTAVSVVVVGAAVGAGWSGGSSISAAAPSADKTQQAVDLDAEIARRVGRIAELERRQAALESDVAETAKRAAAIETRRAAAAKELAELTAPVAPSNEDLAAETVDDRAAGSSEVDDRSRDAATLSPASLSATDATAATDAAGAADAPQSASAVDDMASAERAPIRVFIHVCSADRAARDRAVAVAAELRRRGVTVAQIRGVVRPVRRDAVRFFHDADKAAVTTLQDAVRQASSPGGGEAQPQDFRSYGAPPKPGTLELWLS